MSAVVGVLALVVAVAAVTMLRAMPARAAGYEPRAAWLRGCAYFGACVAVAWLSGTLARFLGDPIVRAGQASDGAWVAWTAAAVGVIAVAYLGVWPRGTLTHGRLLAPGAVAVFGIAWGICEGLLMASVWSVADRILASTWAIVVASFVVISAWLGVWHARYWDIHVAPDHNIPSWNLPKVLFAHTPNLLVTLTYLTLYRNVAIFVGLQTAGLLASTFFMRFPSFRARAASA